MHEEVQSVDLWYYEHAAAKHGYNTVAGIDEAGRGPLAGPVVAAAVVFPIGCDVDGIFDSKQLSSKKRDLAFDKIHSIALSIGVGIISPEEIDRLNILQATYEAMRAAAASITVPVDIYLIDGSPIKNLGLTHKCIVKGDALSASIAAASIVAKVTRDRIMCDYDSMYPEYGFARHKGYPTEEHMNLLSIHGACPIHRKSFAPVAENVGRL